jgi:hypothetical protein
MKTSLCLSVILCWAAFAQTATPTGSITGTLLDSIGDPVDNNVVQAKNTESGAVFKATTSAKGKYTIADLPPGSYDVTGTAPGLTAFVKKGVAVQASQTASLDLRLGDTTQLNTLGEDRLARNRRLEAPYAALWADAAHLGRQARSFRRLVESAYG